MAGVKAVLEVAKARKAAQAALALEVNLLEMLPITPDKVQHVRHLLALTQQVNQVNGSGSAQAAHVDRRAGAASSAAECSGREVGPRIPCGIRDREEGRRGGTCAMATHAAAAQLGFGVSTTYAQRAPPVLPTTVKEICMTAIG